jgi:hypothetical protein
MAAAWRSATCVTVTEGLHAARAAALDRDGPQEDAGAHANIPDAAMFIRSLALLALLAAAPALAQPLPSMKPPPLDAGAPPTLAMPDHAAQAPRCAAPLAQGCLRMQSSCQMACPPMWSTNPSAPAFTPNDRAGCMQRCLTQYLSCQRQYGC